jgi:hypothetical protein
MLDTSEYVRSAVVGILTNSATATGNSQGTALALPSDFVVFTTVAASTGAILPTPLDVGTGTPPAGVVLAGDEIVVVNHGASTLTVYPQSGGKIANGSTNAGFSVSATKMATFKYLGSGGWAASVSA